VASLESSAHGHKSVYARLQLSITCSHALRGKDSNSTVYLTRQVVTGKQSETETELTRQPDSAPNHPECYGGGKARQRFSRDAAASTIAIDTQGTLPALVGTFLRRRSPVTPLPVP